MKPNTIPTDLNGKQFGYLTAIKFDHKDERGHQFWLVNCNACGITKIMRRASLIQGAISCGCVRKKPIRKHSNTYDLSGEYGIGYTKNGETFYFDLEDYDRIKDYNWYINHGKKGDNRPRVVAATLSTDIYTTKTIRMHRLIMGALDDKYKYLDVDHINHNTTDNRKENLRLVTRSQNNMNMSPRKGTSDHAGVSFYKNIGKWVAEIHINGKKIHLGVFCEEEDAIKVREAAEKEYFGDYAYNKQLVIN